VVRIGVAIGIPQPWGEELDRARTQAGDPLAEGIPAHITLLGPTDVEHAALPAITAHLAEAAAAQPRFLVQLRGTGTFRPITEVVFVTVAVGISECEQLAAAVRSGVPDRELHYPYHPHVTVAHDVPGPALDAVFDKLADYGARFEVDHFTLYVHGPEGRWRPIRDFALSAPEPATMNR
jgi:2'-5' RNA ligase